MTALLLSLTLTALAGLDDFADLDLEKPFDKYLKSNKLLMEVTGAKVIKLPGGSRLVLVVTSAPLKDRSAKSLADARVVCNQRMLAALVAEDKGVQVCHTERLEEKTVVVVENGKESAKSVSKLLQLTQTQVRGIAKGMPAVGQWKSGDGEVLYLAFGRFLNAKGEPLDEEPE
jgi:hypothetical protein